MTNTELKEYFDSQFKSLHIANSTLANQIGSVLQEMPKMKSEIASHNTTLYNNQDPKKGLVHRQAIVEERLEKHLEKITPAMQVNRAAVIVAIVSPFISAALTAIIMVMIRQ